MTKLVSWGVDYSPEPINAVDHDRFGIVPAPTRPDQLAWILNLLAHRQVEAWRGHGDASWRIDPSLVRRFKRNAGSDRDPSEATVRALERSLIVRAQRAGFGAETGELELLARLCHHGAATRLLDATRNAYVALWFACRGRLEEDGLLIGLRLRDDNDAFEVKPESLNRSVDDLLAESDGRVLWWQPWDISPRIPAQRALFVFGETVTGNNWGSLKLGETSVMRSHEPAAGNVLGAALILIPVALKRAMNAVWSPAFGFNEETLFPDFDGFAQAQAVGMDFPHDFPGAPRNG